MGSERGGLGSPERIDEARCRSAHDFSTEPEPPHLNRTQSMVRSMRSTRWDSYIYLIARWLTTHHSQAFGMGHEALPPEAPAWPAWGIDQSRYERDRIRGVWDGRVIVFAGNLSANTIFGTLQTTFRSPPVPTLGLKKQCAERPSQARRHPHGPNPAHSDFITPIQALKPGAQPPTHIDYHPGQTRW